MAYLEVHVVCCRGVRGGGLIEGLLMNKADPYVIVNCGGQQQRTRKDKDGGMNANFNQSLHFNFSGRAPPSTLHVQVWDKDIGADDFMAEGTVDIRSVLQSGYMRGFFPLRSKHGWGNGEIELDIKYRGGMSSSGYPPQSPYPPPPMYNHVPPAGQYGYSQPPPPPMAYSSYSQPPYMANPSMYSHQLSSGGYSHGGGYPQSGGYPHGGGYPQSGGYPHSYGQSSYGG